VGGGLDVMERGTGMLDIVKRFSYFCGALVMRVRIADNTGWAVTMNEHTASAF